MEEVFTLAGSFERVFVLLHSSTTNDYNSDLGQIAIVALHTGGLLLDAHRTAIIYTRLPNGDRIVAIYNRFVELAAPVLVPPYEGIQKMLEVVLSEKRPYSVPLTTVLVSYSAELKAYNTRFGLADADRDKSGAEYYSLCSAEEARKESATDFKRCLVITKVGDEEQPKHPRM